MVAKKRGLGRGLDALLGGGARTAATAAEEASSEPVEEQVTQTESSARPQSEPGRPGGDLRELPIDLLQPGKYQPRTDMHFESIEQARMWIRRVEIRLIYEVPY